MTGLLYTATTTPDHPWVLNPHQCHLKTVEGKGRGVFGAVGLQFAFTRPDHRHSQLLEPFRLRP